MRADRHIQEALFSGSKAELDIHDKNDIVQFVRRTNLMLYSMAQIHTHKISVEHEVCNGVCANAVRENVRWNCRMQTKENNL